MNYRFYAQEEEMYLSLEQITDKVLPVARKYNLKAVWVFGSHARNEAGFDSDVDLLIDVEGASGTEWACSNIFSDLEQQFGKGKVDTVTLGAVTDTSGYPQNTKARFRESILTDRRQIYDREG